MNSISDSSTDQLMVSSDPNVPRRGWPAWLLSVLLHSLLFALFLWIVYQVRDGAGEIENKTGGIVLVDATAETTEYLSEGEISDAAAEQSQQPPPLPSAEDRPLDLPGMRVADAPLTGIGEEFADSLTGADSLIVGNTSDRPLGGRVTTEVFGVKGTGSTFVYVFDRSASMEDLGGKPLRAAKKQLLQSLASLGDNQQFQIIFYNDETRIFRPEPGQSTLTFATDAARRRAERFVQSIRGERGTDHLQALKLALAFNPDVVFLLTDAEGGFSSSELRLISDWNRSGAVINAIEFGVGSRSGDRSLKRVADESLGQYIYKDARSFRD